MNGQFRTNFLHSAPGCPLCGDSRTRPRFLIPGSGVLYRCRHCTIEFVSPQPDEEQLKKLYSEAYYAAWGLSGDKENESTRRMKRATFGLRLSLIRRFLQPRLDQPPVAKEAAEIVLGGPRILDVGCATGYFLQLASEQGFQPFGVEISAYAAALARLRVGSDAIFQGVLEEAPFPRASFSAIAMSDLFEHVRVPEQTLRTAESLLKPEGVILIMTPDTDTFSRRVMGASWTHYKPEHLFYFNRKSLTELAKRCGLRPVYIQRSKKALNLAYLHTQFAVYRHWLLSPLAGLLYRLAPESLRGRNFHLSIGEMVAVLKKMP